MSLQEELDRLAAGAPPVPDTGIILRLASRRKARRRVMMVPALATILVLALALPQWVRRADQPVSGHTSVRLLVNGANGVAGRTDLELARSTLDKRLQSLGYRNELVSIMDDGSISIETSGNLSDDDVRGLTARAEFLVRKVLASTISQPTVSHPAAGPGTPTTLNAVVAALGPAYQVAQSLTRPPSSPDPRLAPFGQLTGAQVAALPPDIQFNVPDVTCDLLMARPADAVSAVNDQAVACVGTEKHLLDRAKVSSSDVGGTSVRHEGESTMWTVNLAFTKDGQTRWTDLSREANVDSSTPSCQDSSRGVANHCRIAMMLDTTILTAPEVLSLLTGDCRLAAGNSTEASARMLAAQILSGPLPLTVTIGSVQRSP